MKNSGSVQNHTSSVKYYTIYLCECISASLSIYLRVYILAKVFADWRWHLTIIKTWYIFIYYWFTAHTHTHTSATETIKMKKRPKPKLPSENVLIELLKPLNTVSYTQTHIAYSTFKRWDQCHPFVWQKCSKQIGTYHVMCTHTEPCSLCWFLCFYNTNDK